MVYVSTSELSTYIVASPVRPRDVLQVGGVVAVSSILLRLSQFAKQSSPIVVIQSGIVTLLSEEHPLNVLSPNDVNPSSKFIAFNAVHPEKQYSPHDVMLLGIVNDVILLHPAKHWSPSRTIVLGRVKPIILPQSLKAFSSIAVTV